MKFYTITPKPYIKLRIIATLIDYSLYFVFYTVYIYAFDENPEPGKATVTGIMVLPIIIAWLLYFVVLESAHATPGHDIVKLKVVTDGAVKPSLSTTFKRRLLDSIDIFIYGIPALICISKTPKHQRLGDLWAGTVVVKTTDITEKEVTF
ncbi:RDD family protein [Mucilaginibacter sp. AK015]|uniref:RDD family protein n=1 Tax=Mucilaginibacter sp. AK015 TaxID=2723072 RepID=UPI00161C9DB7|nr:RDD family protein [Mucilaginibacter sp. AK015]MBB5396149.1 putative RDD family membrane protein YckC [Mucilaginibacter sp. AK015]